MKTLILAAIRCSLILTAVAALSIAYPASVQAVPTSFVTTYVYTGNPFTNVSGSYSTSDFVTAMVTLVSPLPPNTPLTQVTPLAFSLSDGVQTWNNLDFTDNGFFFATGPSGNITNWIVFASDTLGLDGIETDNVAFLTVRDVGVIVIGGPEGVGENRGHPGHWRSAAVPDAGSSLALLSLSLTALGVAARQFKRAAA